MSYFSYFQEEVQRYTDEHQEHAQNKGVVPEHHSVPAGINALNLVTFNLLSFFIETEGHRYKLNGEKYKADEKKRLSIIVQQITDWMSEGKVICLQEVTRPVHTALSWVVKTMKYQSYVFTYDWRTKKDIALSIGWEFHPAANNGEFMLGLMTLVPIDMPVEHSAVIYPWRFPLVSLEDRIKVQNSGRKVETVERDLKALNKAAIPDGIIQTLVPKYNLKCNTDQPKKGDVCRMMADVLKQAKVAFNGVYDAVAKKPTYHLRGMQYFVIKIGPTDDDKIVIVNGHMPCQYRKGIMPQITMLAQWALYQKLQKDGLLNCPRFLVGDLNIEPSDKAFFTLLGNLSDSMVDQYLCQDMKYAAYKMQWTLPEDSTSGEKFTTFGLSQDHVDKCITQDVPLMPNPLNLDHCLMSDPKGRVSCAWFVKSTLDEIQAKFAGNPLPALDQGAPSDHLPVHFHVDFVDASAEPYMPGHA